MLQDQTRSKLFAFALKAQSAYGKVMGLTILWSIWALFFSNINPIFISNIILSAICLGLALIASVILEYKTFITIEIEILYRLRIKSAYPLFRIEA